MGDDHNDVHAQLHEWATAMALELEGFNTFEAFADGRTKALMLHDRRGNALLRLCVNEARGLIEVTISGQGAPKAVRDARELQELARTSAAMVAFFTDAPPQAAAHLAAGQHEQQRYPACFQFQAGWWQRLRRGLARRDSQSLF